MLRVTNRAPHPLIDPKDDPACQKRPPAAPPCLTNRTVPLPDGAASAKCQNIGNAPSWETANPRAPDQDSQDAKANHRPKGNCSPNAHPAGHLRQRRRPNRSTVTHSGRPHGKGNHPSHTDTAACHNVTRNTGSIQL
ncbi:hypothetical protein WOLCODRAFT_159083 [Wolfiporia cocos MD-104 SS10]|uniref:Uncharacterized protein n=1 Tax=Wolfiporia cocos (strain MD-104) TaxID=742152 RepID=A0A2H3JD52_WOLCO|nr:hypothetical protein WOLCODRAFT_159083 [Wolfiporia cocos MD-104 SS10]